MNGSRSDLPSGYAAPVPPPALPIAYIKAFEMDGKPGYAIHAANGEMIGWCEERAVAFAAAAQHDLVALSVH